MLTIHNELSQRDEINPQQINMFKLQTVSQILDKINRSPPPSLPQHSLIILFISPLISFYPLFLNKWLLLTSY